MRASSTDLRERSVRVVADGQPLREAARRFGVRVSAVKRSVVRQQETGSLERTPIPGGPRKIKREHEALLQARLQAAPDATVLTRLSGWAPHDRRATGSVPRTHGTKTTLVAALTPDGVQAPWMIEGAMDSATFEWDIAEQLAPRLRPGQVVVRDHLSAHTAASIREALEARGCSVLFLPPYSPDFTPIEQAFSKLKALLRGLGARTREALEEAVRLAVEAITRDDATAWFAHAGYALPAQAT
jgi:transposase